MSKRSLVLLLTVLLNFGVEADPVRLKVEPFHVGERDLEKLKQRGLAAINKLLLDRDRLLKDREKLLEECKYLRNRLENFNGDEEAIRLSKMLTELEGILLAGDGKLLDTAKGVMSKIQALRKEKEFITQQLVQQRILARRARRVGVMVVGTVAIIALGVALVIALKKLSSSRKSHEQEVSALDAKLIEIEGDGINLDNQRLREIRELNGRVELLTCENSLLTGEKSLLVEHLDEQIEKIGNTEKRLKSRRWSSSIDPRNLWRHDD
jgi:microcompartment protein CcmK/EutM